MIEAARHAKRLLMEAMWPRFLPAIAKTRELISTGLIGDVRRVTADFGFAARFDPGDRLFDPRLGGGALLDVGVYPVSLAHMILGAPETILGLARIGGTGVDEEAAVLLGYEGGSHAVLSISITLETARDARIDGTKGWIRLPERWWAPRSITLGGGPGPYRTLELPFRGSGFVDEIEAFVRLARSGATESPVMPPGESLAVMRTMDGIRERWGLRYPSE